MANFKIRCRLIFHLIKSALLKQYALTVRNGIFNNPGIFTSPPMTQLALEALIADYGLKYENYKNRIGTKGDFLTAKTALMNALDILAEYVDGVAQNNPDTIILAGYVPTKGVTNNVPAPLQAQNVTITRGTPGTLTTDCDPVLNADSYGVILVADSPLPENITMTGTGQLQVLDDTIRELADGAVTSAGPTVPMVRAIMDLNKNRRKTFINLVIGTTYYVYYWSMNAGGVSPLSVVLSKKVLEG